MFDMSLLLCPGRPETLRTERLTLRPLKMSDAQDLFAYAQDPEVSRHVLWKAHRSIADSRRFLRAGIRQYRRGFPGSYAIVLNENGRMIGTIGYMWINSEFRSCEIGYSLSRDHWNRGLMTEALQAVIRHSFDTLSLNRVECQHEVDNPASGRVMQKAGMRFEGIMRQRIRNKNKYSDVAVYAVLQSDMPTAGKE
ncbi:MAG: GNAT family N-acetyltransferase [Clostridia bacterium]|nr:GNAT family N-acetyltransferase [Clostridia bacterium]